MQDSRALFAVLIIIVLSTGYFIYQKRQLNNLDQSETKSPIEYETTYREDETNSGNPVKQQNEKIVVESEKLSAQEELPPSLIEDKSMKTVTTQPSKLEIEFAELSTQNGLEILSRGNPVGVELKGAKFNLSDKLSQFVADQKNKHGLVQIYGLKTDELTREAPVSKTFTASSESGEESGLSLEIFLKEKTAESMTIEIKGQVFLELTGAEPFTSNFVEEFNLKIGDTIALTGILPPIQNIKESLTHSFNGTPLSILSSEDFKNQNSDLFLIIQAQ
ncbi:MAG: hypothetical protein KDD50_15030 [Bdellovibrionales bacterium]|nr:hypothetical protein [Bdellovibrionales bacterium]